MNSGSRNLLGLALLLGVAIGVFLWMRGEDAPTEGVEGVSAPQATAGTVEELEDVARSELQPVAEGTRDTVTNEPAADAKLAVVFGNVRPQNSTRAGIDVFLKVRHAGRVERLGSVQTDEDGNFRLESVLHDGTERQRIAVTK